LTVFQNKAIEKQGKKDRKKRQEKKEERHQEKIKIGLKQNMRSFSWKMPLQILNTSVRSLTQIYDP
jgi:hypothetical protein